MKVIKTKKEIAAICTVVFICTAFFLQSSPGRALLASAAKRDLPIYNVQKDYKVCSLSFDISTGEQNTGELIEILKKYDIKASFFVAGKWAEQNQEAVKQLFDAGHEIMNRSDTNVHMPQLSVDAIKEEVNRCNSKIQKITGIKPLLFRPPYGDYDDKVISTIRSMGMYTALWNCDSLDRQQHITADKICERVLKTVRPGSILLFHCDKEETLKALPEVIEGLMQEGYEFAPVSHLIYRDDYFVDYTGKQIPDVNAGHSDQKS